MPKSRTRSGSTKNIAASSSSNPSTPLRVSKHSSTTQNHNTNNGRSETSTNQNSFPHSIKTNNQDLSKLSAIVTDLITCKRDQSAYQDFLLILENFSVRSLRDDHLEETFYHLIQAAVTFIRANQQRFDNNKLEECYRHRHNHKMNSIQ